MVAVLCWNESEEDFILSEETPGDKMANFFDDLLNECEDVAGESIALDCLERFDSDSDHCLSLRELCSLMRELFVDGKGDSYELPVRICAEIFYAFDTDRDGIISREEFLTMWPSFVIPILHPKSALIIIDVQNDFIDGSLAIRNCPAGQEGKEVVPVINELLENVPFNYVFYTYDWHPDDHVSFIDNVHLRKFHKNCSISADEAQIFDTVTFSGPPKIEQKLWPKHCVQESWGSELHPDLTISENAIFIYKGTCPDIDSYSAFWDNQKLSQTNLSDELSSRGVTDVYLCGLATEYCVKYTALHSLELGYRTILIEDACRGVALDDIQNMKEELVANHGVIVTSDSVRKMVIGRDRRLDLGYRTAMTASSD